MLELQNVSKIYPMGSYKVNALANVTLEIEKSEFISIIGRSGSGKSTLLNIIGCLDKPTTGTLLLDNENLTTLKDEMLPMIRQQKIGLVFQHNNLIPTLTALENLLLPLKYSRTSKKEALERTLSLLKEVNLLDRKDHYPHQLSGGQQQRVAIARALVNKPSLILADEPTGSVDSKTAKEILNLMRRLNMENKQTFIIVTHDPLVTESTDRTYEMKDGQLIS